jgi:hypothetical protein
MPLSLILACLWVLAAAIVALLPMRFQYVPGLALLILSVPLAVYVGVEVGWIWVALVLFAVLSMFRRPLMALVKPPAPPICRRNLMPLVVIFALVWVLLAGGALALPERFRWSLSWALIGTGIPLLGFVTLQAGPVFGLGGLAIAVLLISRAALAAPARGA